MQRVEGLDFLSMGRCDVLLMVGNHQDSVLLSTCAAVLFVPCGYQTVICVDLLLLQNFGGFQSQSLFQLAREALFAKEMMFLFRDIRWSALSASSTVLLGRRCWDKESIRGCWVHNVFSISHIATWAAKEAQIFHILAVTLAKEFRFLMVKGLHS